MINDTPTGPPNSYNTLESHCLSIFAPISGFVPLLAFLILEEEDDDDDDDDEEEAFLDGER
jgi:hypothetical protein